MFLSEIFYYARVSSYLEHYPATQKETIPTPLFVEVYCRTITPTQNWCRDTMQLTANNIINNGEKTYQGWYLNTQHDSATEGTASILVNVSGNANEVTTNYNAISHNFVNGKIKTSHHKKIDLHNEFNIRYSILMCVFELCIMSITIGFSNTFFKEGMQI